jgi:hypothetical protein
MGAIQGMLWEGPREVQAKPKRPMASRGATGFVSGVWKVWGFGGGSTVEEPPESCFWFETVRVFAADTTEPVDRWEVGKVG